jgi:putative selenate reductase
MYPTPAGTIDYRDLLIAPDGSISPEGCPIKQFHVREAMQIGIYADFCNECGNCDTFCPERGGPYKEKPGLYGSLETWEAAAPRDGVFIRDEQTRVSMLARFKEKQYTFELLRSPATYRFYDGVVAVTIDAETGNAIRADRDAEAGAEPHIVEMEMFFLLKVLLDGLLHPAQVNQINVATHQALAPTAGKS